LYKEGYYVDASFIINHFSFGKKTDFNTINSLFPNQNIKHPLDGFKQNVEFTEIKAMRQGRSIEERRPFGIQTNIFVDAVPSIFKFSYGEFFNTEVFQLKVS
jgi:hypothetical protein